MKWVGQHIYDLIARFRNDVIINSPGTHLKLEANADPTNDYATFTVADTGDLTITTVGDGTTDSDLILSADGKINLEPADGRVVNILSTETSSSTVGGRLNLQSNDSAALGDDHMLGRIGFQAAEDGSGTFRQGASIQAFADAAWSASENGTRLEFYTMDGNNTSELSLTLDSDLLATFAGAVTITGLTTLSGNLTFDSIALTGIQASGESFADDDVSLMTSAAINDAIIKGGNTTTIKVLPYQFMQNEEGGVNKSVQFDESGTIGVKSTSADGELFAFVEIPIGKTATSVTVYGSDTNNVVQVYELDINASAALGGTDGSGNNVTNASGCVVGTACDIVDVASDATNYLVIEVTVTALTDIVYGAAVTVSG